MDPRVEAIRNYIILRNRPFAELMVWVPTEVDPDTPHLAYATRTKAYLSPQVFDLPLPQQAAILVHEVMHVVCRHVQTTQKEGYHPLLANIAQDALINEAIAGQSWLKLPEDGIRFSRLVTDRSRPWEQWSWQQVYWWLLKNLPREKGPNSIFVDSAYMPEGEKGESLKIPEFRPDLESGSNEEQEGEEHTDDIQEQIWQQRVQRVMSNDPKGLLRALAPLLTQKKSNWRKVLRHALQVAMNRVPTEDWTRPGRRTLAKLVPYYEPARIRTRTLPRIAVVFDTSGSIDDKTLQVFVSEVEAIRRQHQAEVYILSCDAKVQGEMLIKNDGRSLEQHLKDHPELLRGGGGTDFEPALARAEELRSRLCIYFTDLEGTFGRKPKHMQVVWATTSNKVPPFGRVVRIDSP